MFFITLMMIPRHSGVDASPSQPCILQHGKTNICQKCGDKGDLKRLIYCDQCQVSAEHSYCLEKPHKEDDETFSWKCEECAQRDSKCGLEQLRKSGRIRQATEAKSNRMKMQKKSASLRKKKAASFLVLEQAHMCRSSETESSSYLENNDIDHENQDLPIKKRRLDLDDENSYEESESLQVPVNVSSDQPALESEKYVQTKPNYNTVHLSEFIMSHGLLYPECNKISQAKLFTDPVWRGQFRMNNMTLLGLVAHLSSKACSKVHCAVSELPPLLDVELLSRSDIWSRTFQMSPPADGNIALYFFPQYESDEVVFDGVLNDVIERNLALKAIIANNVELLIFSSRVLPPENWRTCRKYYLWGVFRQKGASENTGSN